jgi:hypothetical protein
MIIVAVWTVPLLLFTFPVPKRRSPSTCCAQEKAMTIILSRVDEIANEAERKNGESETSGGAENGKLKID